MSRDELLKQIRTAEEEIRNLCATDENKRRNAVWASAGVSSDYFHAIPADKKYKPLVIEFEREAYAGVLGYDFIDFYKDPYVHYLSGLRTQIFKFKNFDDDTPISMSQPVYESCAFEKSIFGGEQAIYTEHDAVVSKNPLINCREDFDALEYPDFFTSGCMPRTIGFYEKVRDIAADDFSIAFPQWGRSAWGVAWQMRGIDNLMLDCIDDPEWLDDMLEFFTQARKHWTLRKNKYLGIELHEGNIYNDEVTAPLVSPKLYEEHILKGEAELSEFFGGISYWHSCGITTNLYEKINRIPNLKMVTVSAWSDVAKAGREYSKEIALEVQLHNYRDVLKPSTADTMKTRIEQIKAATSDHKAIVHACGLICIEGLDKTLKQLQKLSEVTRQVMG